MAKFQYRGMEIEELKKMNYEDVKRVLPSSQRRALKRGLRKPHKMLLERIKKNPGKFYRTKSRDIIITPELFEVKLGVYNGKEYVPLEIKPEMLGFRLGEFVHTRKPVKHSSPGFGATKSSKFVPLK